MLTVKKYTRGKGDKLRIEYAVTHDENGGESVATFDDLYTATNVLRYMQGCEQSEDEKDDAQAAIAAYDAAQADKLAAYFAKREADRAKRKEKAATRKGNSQA